MLKEMENLGSIGASKKVTLYSDGDGDFRPKFNWSSGLPDIAEPRKRDASETLFDTG